MIRAFALLAALGLALPLAGSAQTTSSPPPDTAAAPAPEKPADKLPPAAKPAGVTFTPYGFVLLNAFFDAGPFATRDYPGQASTTRDGTAGPSFLMSARQSRLGFRLAMPDDPWTGAKISMVMEFDFKGGHIATSAACPAVAANTANTCTIGTANSPSTSWYNGLMRLRLAYGKAAWKSGYGEFSILAGQEYGLVAPLFATSLAWVADPLFWQAGNLWRRSPQIRLAFESATPIGFSAAGAMLSPADAGTPVDNGFGNRSRTPDFEGRVAVFAKAGGKKMAEVGASGHWNKRRYVNPSDDVTATVWAVDADLNTQFLGVRGEAYMNKGAGDTYNAIVPGAAPGTNGVVDNRAIESKGFWAQAVLKPVPQVNFTVGYGAEQGDAATFRTAPAVAAGTRERSSQFAAGVILNASNPWKFGFEGIKVISSSFGGAGGAANRAESWQLALSSKVDF
jgi:hypothetical protein